MSYRYVDANALCGILKDEDYEKVLAMSCVYADVAPNNQYVQMDYDPNRGVEQMGRLIDTDSLKDRASEYTLNEDEYRRFCEIIDAEPTAYDPDKVLERVGERTAFLKDCTKYGNETAEQQDKSYSTMMMYEVKDLVDDLIEIVKGGGVDA